MSVAAPPRQGLDSSALLSLVSPEWRKAGRLVEIEAAGASMAPLIREGNRLGLRMTDDRALRAGDVFAFEREGAVVVHRLVAKRREGAGWRLGEKGDGCSSWSWVEGGAVIGRVETIHRAGRCLDLRQRPWRWAASAGARLWSAGIAAAESSSHFMLSLCHGS